MKTKQLGNMGFNLDYWKDKSYDEFEQVVRGELQGCDIKKAYKAITGKAARKSGKTRKVTKKTE